MSEASWRTLAKGGTGLAVAYALLLLVWRTPPTAVLLVAGLLPLAAIVLARASGGFVRLSGVADPDHPSVFVMLMGPAMLGFRAVEDGNLVTVWPAIGLAVALGAVLLALVWIADRRVVEDLGLAAVLVFCLSAAAGGGILEFNRRADSAPAQDFQAMVSERWLPMKTAGYRLRLSAWGPLPAGQAARVAKLVYRGADVGQPVCPRLRSGALGLPWYEVRLCGSPATPADGPPRRR